MYENASPRARDIIADLAARGQYHFTSSEFHSAKAVSEAAARQALSRLAAKGEIASPARGFYVIVPPEYRRLDCLPADQSISALMERRNVRYYVGLLSAAQYHGPPRQRSRATVAVRNGASRANARNITCRRKDILRFGTKDSYEAGRLAVSVAARARPETGAPPTGGRRIV